jgi:hypothetical protein
MVDIRQGRCPLCSHNEIIQALPLEFCGAIPFPLAAAHLKTSEGGPSPLRPVGVFNVFTCRRCGYTQWFADQPAQIPIGETFGTRLVVGPEPIGPYR